MQQDAKFDFRVALLPTMTQGSPRVSALGEGDNVILAHSKHPKEAFEFLEYLVTQMPHVWNDWGFLPTEKVDGRESEMADRLCGLPAGTADGACARPKPATGPIFPRRSRPPSSPL